MVAHRQNDKKDGGPTTSTLDRILYKSTPDNNIDNEFKAHCRQLDITQEDRKRRYWLIDSAETSGGGGDLPLTNSQVEGAYNQDRSAKFRNRNAQIIAARKQHDNYTCCVCNFCFEVHGVFIIDCHHKYPLREGERMTNLDDLVCLCPICHRIARSKSTLSLSVKFKLPDKRQACECSTDSRQT